MARIKDRSDTPKQQRAGIKIVTARHAGELARQHGIPFVPAVANAADLAILNGRYLIENRFARVQLDTVDLPEYSHAFELNHPYRLIVDHVIDRQLLWIVEDRIRDRQAADPGGDLHSAGDTATEEITRRPLP